jgi:hypothetical protein
MHVKQPDLAVIQLRKLSDERQHSQGLLDLVDWNEDPSKERILCTIPAAWTRMRQQERKSRLAEDAFGDTAA